MQDIPTARVSQWVPKLIFNLSSVGRSVPGLLRVNRVVVGQECPLICLRNAPKADARELGVGVGTVLPRREAPREASVLI
jgi:hypothetical protein